MSSRRKQQKEEKREARRGEGGGDEGRCLHLSHPNGSRESMARPFYDRYHSIESDDLLYGVVHVETRLSFRYRFHSRWWALEGRKQKTANGSEDFETS